MWWNSESTNEARERNWTSIRSYKWAERETLLRESVSSFHYRNSVSKYTRLFKGTKGNVLSISNVAQRGSTWLIWKLRRKPAQYVLMQRGGWKSPMGEKAWEAARKHSSGKLTKQQRGWKQSMTGKKDKAVKGETVVKKKREETQNEDQSWNKGHKETGFKLSLCPLHSCRL